MMKYLPLLAFGLFALSATANEPPKVLALGSPAPEFRLPDVNGKEMALADFASAKALCLIFTCNHCPSAVQGMERIRKLHEDYAPKGVAIVAINPNNPVGLRPDELGYSPYGDSFEEMKPYYEQAGWKLPYLYDGEKQELAMACGAQATPHAFLFDAERKLRYNGRLDDGGRNKAPAEVSQIRNALEAVLSGKEVAEPVTRPIGCSTKWIWKAESVAEDQKKWEALPVTMEDVDAEGAAKLAKPLEGRVRLINFWSTSCAPCVAEFPDLVDTYRRFQNRSFDMVTISMDESDRAERAKKFLAEQHAAISPRHLPFMKKENRTAMNFRFSGENPDALAEAIDPKWSGALPHSVIVDSSGKVLWSHTGEIEVVALRRAILEALNRQ
ncbi:MAG: redoxin family protein [Verrucomicrobiales bacterium]